MTTVIAVLFFSDFFFRADFFSDGGIAFNTIPNSSSKIESKSATASSALRLRLSSSAAVLSQWAWKATMSYLLKRKTLEYDIGNFATVKTFQAKIKYVPIKKYDSFILCSPLLYREENVSTYVLLRNSSAVHGIFSGSWHRTVVLISWRKLSIRVVFMSIIWK